jgi:hypothetical protein
MYKNILIFMAGMCLFLTSCHSDYLHIDYSVHNGAVSSISDSNSIAFVVSKLAYLPAEGISRFPDGGTPDYLIEDVSLYVFNQSTHHLRQIVNFNDLVDVIGPSAGRWKSQLIFEDSLVYYKISPTLKWDFIASWKNNSRDSTQLLKIKNKYSHCYSIDLRTNKIEKANEDTFNSRFEKFKSKQKISLSELNKLLNNIPLSDWGLSVQKILPKTEEDYINETIYLKNDSKVTRRAVVEQIISKLSEKEIKSILQKMDEHKNSLEGLEKTEYEMYSKDTYACIKRLL